MRQASELRRNSDKKGTAMAATDLPTIDVNVTGMTCDGCATKVRTALTETQGIAAADVDFASGRVSVHPDGTVDTAALEFAIDSAIFDAGYRVV